MRILESLKENKIVVIAVLLILIVVLGYGYYLNTSKLSTDTNNGSASNVATNYKGYSDLLQKIRSLNTIKYENIDVWVNKIVENLKPLENSSISEKDKYNAILLASGNLSFLYTGSQDPKAKDVYGDLNSFAKVNFPSNYNARDFVIYCQDTSCQDTPQPPEILKIVDEIKASNAANYAKQSLTANLLSVGYISKNQPLVKARLYYVSSSSLRHDGELTKAGINNKLADEVYNFVLATYPDQAKELNLAKLHEQDMKL